MSTKPKAILALENGKVFEGISFGASGEATGEVVFHTGMTGYQEIITDPSYKGQIVAMTYPHIGNTGINPFDNESDGLHLEALVVKEYCDMPSSWRAKQSLKSFLTSANVVGIEGIDTRHLTRILRAEGALRAVVSTENLNADELIQKAKSAPHLQGQNLAAKVSTDKVYKFYEQPEDAKYHVVAFDLGIKQSILKRLSQKRCCITVVPYNASAETILDLNPNGIFLSNGPGDPAAVTHTVETVKKLIGKKPIFGICLGHQILSLALGATTSKLKFGHHGANHPVQSVSSRDVEITSQNHSFVVDLNSLPKSVELTHVNLNDHTVEGFRDTQKHLFSVQYHPEAAPGPHDSYYLFEDFIKQMESNNR